MSRSRKWQVMFAHAFYDSVIFFVFLGFIFCFASRSRARSRAIGRSGVGCHCEKGAPLTLAAHARGALPLVRAAWGVTARKSSHNASNARGVAAGKMGRNSSFSNPPYIYPRHFVITAVTVLGHQLFISFSYRCWRLISH